MINTMTTEEPVAGAPNIADGMAVRVDRSPRFALVRHTIALARRSLIKTLRTPEALIDVTIHFDFDS
jgi:oleandomycin transport system permease protein